jgi:ankyrin repeat protein
MARLEFWVLLGAVVGGSHALDELSDFSNNLATDVGPLLVLFGEAMTKQFLSESISFLDYFIFAMAPIGIITAVVSTIRVCGHPSLRAFIGRAQEGDGVVEAELCTSTSRDVCELFNKGGITRVLGRPSILELVYVPPVGDGKSDPADAEVEKAGLFLFRSYLEKRGAGWRRVQPSIFSRYRKPVNPFAPKPNLSVNVGIKQRSPGTFILVAAAGFTLQAGILALAGVGRWILHWNLEDGDSSTSNDYAPIMFITGTVLMCSGMLGCAALIGQTTVEVRYKRESRSHRLIWLQPGPQVIGDQNFDPFAYLDRVDQPLQHWTSSRKDLDEKFEVYTLLAVIAVIVGYIMQFIGLRGMKAWVSIAQLGATIVMSIMRAGLRMQRLGRNDNKLRKMPDLVSGHELDWLAFEIVRRDSPKQWLWHFNGKHGPAFTAAGSAGLEGGAAAVTTEVTTGSQDVVSGESQSCQELLALRVRLAHLTGHVSFGNIEATEYQKWGDETIKVRTRARQLSAAICQASESIFQQRRRSGDITVQVKATMARVDDSTAFHTHPISITLKPPPESTQTGWRIDSAQLEAVLGLWMWSLASDERLESTDNPGHGISAGRVGTARMVSAGLDDVAWERDCNRQRDMNLWLGSSAVTYFEKTFTIDESQDFGFIDIWGEQRSTLPDELRPLPRASERPDVPKKNRNEYKQRLWRLCGWNLVHESLRRTQYQPNSGESPSQSPVVVRVQLVSTNRSILDTCTQELFVALTSSLTSLSNIGRTTIVEADGAVRLDNPTVACLTKSFAENSLGTYSEAFSCVIPALGNQLRPDPDILLSALIKEADARRHDSEWERAEVLLRWACQQHFHSPTGERELTTKALRATGELYRWSLHTAHQSNIDRKTFGMEGIKWMIENFNQEGGDQEVTETLDCYSKIADWILGVGRLEESENEDSDEDIIEEDSDAWEDSDDADDEPGDEGDDGDGEGSADSEDSENDDDDDDDDDGDGSDGSSVDNASTESLDEVADELLYGSASHRLVRAIRERSRALALYRLCFVGPGDLSARNLQAALPLAVRNDWGEVVTALLEMKANINSQDKFGRTAITYSARYGHDAEAKRFVDLGAFLDHEDKDFRTPLIWAVTRGHEGIAKLLILTGHVDHTRQNPVSGHSPLTMAVVKGQIDLVRLLLARGADIETRDESEDTLLSLAASHGYEAIVAMLLDLGAAVDRAGRDQQTPLSRAAEEGMAAIVRRLLDAGAEVDSEDNCGRAPLAWAAAHKSGADAVKILLEHGAKTESRNGTGRTALSWAAGDQYGGAAVELLIQQGADLESKDDEGRTPLFWASVNHRNIAPAKVLLDSGADIEARNISNRTPLSWVAASSWDSIAETVELLLERGAEVESIDDSGRTPLSWAVHEHANKRVVEALLDAGAKVETSDKTGRTPLSWAKEEKCSAEIIELLESK